MRVRAFGLGLALCVVVGSAGASPTEADAVVKYCGTPGAESRATSQVDGHMQRTFTYGDYLLHFEPEGGGWVFTSGWHGHFPQTRNELEKKLPCFKTAMGEAAGAIAASPVATDPTIAEQTQPQQPFDTSTFGIPHFWLIVVLVAVFLLLILIPSARSRQAKKRAAANVDEPMMPTVHRTPDLPNVRPVARHKDLDDV